MLCCVCVCVFCVVLSLHERLLKMFLFFLSFFFRKVLLIVTCNVPMTRSVSVFKPKFSSLTLTIKCIRINFFIPTYCTNIVEINYRKVIYFKVLNSSISCKIIKRNHEESNALKF